MGPIAQPEPVHLPVGGGAVRPTSDGFTRVGNTPVGMNGIWMLGGGGNVPVQNIECYKAVALKNTFSAITEPHVNTIIDEKWPTLVESLAPPSQAERRAQKAAFWMRSVKDRERDRRRRSREDDELMQNFIDEQIDAQVSEARTSDWRHEEIIHCSDVVKCRTAAPRASASRAQQQKVRFCGPYLGPCKDDCCEKSVTDEQACDAFNLNELSTSKELVKSELLTSDELVKSELLMSKEPVKGSGLVTSVVEAAEAAAPSTLDAEKNMPVPINGIGDAEDVSRSVRWGKGSQKPHEVNGISEDQLTGPVAMRFNISSVQRPLAAASRVASSGNRIVLEGEGGYIESVATGDRIALRLERGVYVFDVILPSGEKATIALDSGAGVCVWPETWQVAGELEAKDENLSMIAANGTQISNIGQKVILFRAMKPFTGP